MKIKPIWHFIIYFLLSGMNLNAFSQTWTSQTLPSTNTLRSVYFQNVNEGWAAGYDGIIHTSNGGSDWISQIAAFPYRLLAIRFTDVNYGWANAGLKILRTENGGGLWNDMSGLDPNAAIFRNVIFPVSATVAWATAQGGGQRWFYRYTATSSTVVTEQTFGLITSGVQLLDLWFINQDIGWAVGTSGQIWKITNASTESPGFSNQTNTLVTSSTLRGVFFLDQNNGWAVGDGGTIIKTINGGTDWSILSSGTNANLKDVYFQDQNNGCAVGESGMILVTTDAGVNWSTQISGVTTTLWSVIYINSSRGYIAGGDLSTSGNGTILRTDIPSQVQNLSEGTSEFTLNQNFPNPFNNSTEIKFYSPYNDLVSLTVYDIHGKQIATLINEKLNSGSYSITLDATRLSNGIYFYSLKTKSGIQTRKLLVNK